MTAPALHALVASRLAEAPSTLDGASELVLAAFEGRESVEAALAGTRGQARAGTAPAAAALPPTFLESITVEGFRGVGPAVTLTLCAGPGLTVVAGRNGSGKSSLAEALEMLLTGSNRRWAERAKVWGAGWRNLHHPTPRIAAAFRVEGQRAPLVVERTWAAEADVGASSLSTGGKAVSLQEWGWTQALQAYPPLLSHNELGRILDKPSELYDALSGILGLEDITTAQTVLRDLRLAAQRAVRDQADAASKLVGLLEQIDDERATAVVRALSVTPPRLDEVEQALARSVASEAERSELGALRALSQLPVLDRESVRALAEELREAYRVVEAQRGTDAARARETATLLRQALRAHSEHEHDPTCPVCGSEGRLTTSWRLATTTRVAELETEAAAADAAHTRERTARAAALDVVQPVPAALSGTVPGGIDTGAARLAWERWAQLDRDADALTLSRHLDTHAAPLIEAVASLRAAAGVELERREDRWRPVARNLAAWLPSARDAEVQRASLPRLRAAETWLNSQHESLRAERFDPIAGQVQALWKELRQSSDVQMGAVTLQGTRTSSQRRVAVDVTVDGSEGSALGVMSQGELNCLALSLFLPRAAMPESPFRFVVIDDPVQAMDEVKVEGLARALAQVAATRQVVVLTHDDRLPMAMRRLDLCATVVEVSRRENSVVQLLTRTDPVRRYIDDAMAVAQTAGLPAQAGRVVPGFCRMALEAACGEAVWRRLVRNGVPFAQAEARLHEPTTLNTWLALYLFDDAARAGDVMPALNRRGRVHAADVVKVCNKGTHSAIGTDAVDLVRNVEKLAASIVAGTL
ncbi:MAG: AAA family ATPase [Candidatus Dormibacteria bacterium]